MALGKTNSTTDNWLLVWEGAEVTGTDWGSAEKFPSGDYYYLSVTATITPSIDFTSANTLAINVERVLPSTAKYTLVEPDDWFDFTGTTLETYFNSVVKVWRHIYRSDSGLSNWKSTEEIWLQNDGNFRVVGYQKSDEYAYGYPVWIEKLYKQKI